MIYMIVQIITDKAGLNCPTALIGSTNIQKLCTKQILTQLKQEDLQGMISYRLFAHLKF